MGIAAICGDIREPPRFALTFRLGKKANVPSTRWPRSRLSATGLGSHEVAYERSLRAFCENFTSIWGGSCPDFRLYLSAAVSWRRCLRRCRMHAYPLRRDAHREGLGAHP